jgi:hypothetical protein
VYLRVQDEAERLVRDVTGRKREREREIQKYLSASAPAHSTECKEEKQAKKNSDHVREANTIIFNLRVFLGRKWNSI